MLLGINFNYRILTLFFLNLNNHIEDNIILMSLVTVNGVVITT